MSTLLSFLFFLISFCFFDFFLLYVSPALYQMSTAWLSSLNHGLVKLRTSHAACRGWAKEVKGVSLVEVTLPKFPPPN